MIPVRILTGRVVVMEADHLDTDQIIPARFLTALSRTGLGRHLFADRRVDPAGRPRPDCPLNHPDAARASILMAGRDFGCGSSREHAAWALTDAGFRAVVAISFADIFRRNALNNGLVPVALAAPGWRALRRWLAEHPTGAVTVDVARRRVGWPGSPGRPFPLEAFARRCLLAGVDDLGWILDQFPAIEAFEHRRADPAPPRP